MFLPSDQKFIDSLMEKYNSCYEDVYTELRDVWYKLPKSIADITNAYIYCIFSCMIRELEFPLIAKYCDKIRELLFDGIYTNCSDSRIQTKEAVDYVRSLKIKKDIKAEIIEALENL